MPCKPTADDCDRQTRILRPGSQRRGMIGGVGKEAVRQAFRPSGLGARIRRAVARRWGTNWTDVETRASSHQSHHWAYTDTHHCSDLRDTGLGSTVTWKSEVVALPNRLPDRLPMILRKTL
eukprot:1178007-Prorocentrum_minimum.AAC.3